MKALKNGEIIPERVYLYLIDFRYRDKNQYFQKKTFNEDNLVDLSAKEIAQYFLYTSSSDINEIKHHQEKYHGN